MITTGDVVLREKVVRVWMAMKLKLVLSPSLTRTKPARICESCTLGLSSGDVTLRLGPWCGKSGKKFGDLVTVVVGRVGLFADWLPMISWLWSCKQTKRVLCFCSMACGLPVLMAATRVWVYYTSSVSILQR